MTSKHSPSFKRFAVYYLCDDGPLADFGAAWLGWDVVSGQTRPHPAVPGFRVSGSTLGDAPAPRTTMTHGDGADQSLADYGLHSAQPAQPDTTMPADTPLPGPIEQLTKTPRKYGFHATIKPPFHLAEGRDVQGLTHAARMLCASFPPVHFAGLALSSERGFLALRPLGDTRALSQLAAAIVRGLDPFRAPISAEDLARRRARALSDRQESLLVKWGYPYVMEEFNFHMTLSGRMKPDAASAAQSALKAHIAHLLGRRFTITSVALVGADDLGRFHLIERLPLGSM